LTGGRSGVEIHVEDESRTVVIRIAGSPHGLDYDLAVEAADAVFESVTAAGGSCEVVESPSPPPDQSRGDAVIVMRLPCE
jgi:hypothetical protein